MKSTAYKHATSLPPRTFRVVMSAHKVVATVSWDSKVTVMTDYIENGSTITETYYADMVGKCQVALKEK